MLLSHIVKKKYNYKNILTTNLKFFIKNFKNKIFVLKTTKLEKNTKKLKFIVSAKHQIFCVEQDLIKYIITIHVSKTNTLINITDIKGNLKLFISAGSVKLNGKQKVKQPTAFINILKILITKAKFLKNKPVAVHFKNINTYYELFLINMLKSKFFIKIIRSYNLQPHNGCRPKKIKRKKRRLKIFYFEGMTEWLKVADCKSVGYFHRRFKSYFLQRFTIK